jgi:hypothetical protein
VIGRSTTQIRLPEVSEAEGGAGILTLPWTPPSPCRKREIIQGIGDAEMNVRPMRANARAIDPDRSCWRRPSLARRTSVRSAPDFAVAGFSVDGGRLWRAGFVRVLL